MALKIVTNHHWRELVYAEDVPKHIMEEDFDWADEFMTDGYFSYRGIWYHLNQFMRVAENFGPPVWDNVKCPWDGFLSDSFYSGILIKHGENEFGNEAIKVATFSYRGS